MEPLRGAAPDTLLDFNTEIAQAVKSVPVRRGITPTVAEVESQIVYNRQMLTRMQELMRRSLNRAV